MNAENIIRDLFEPKIRFSIVEDAGGEVDGVNILAKIKGEFFFPDGVSRNKRFYGRKVWENVMNSQDIKDKLDKRLMFGTIGHDQELNDKAIREGLISHFMTSISIDGQGRGIGEAMVLNTPVGKILNTALRAGCQLCVSSRADGKFKGTVENVPAIDPDNFLLIGWDFVMDPGFLKANPSIAEAFNKTVTETIKGGDKNMDQMQKLVEHITSENHDLKSKNGDLTTENTTLRESNRVVNEENQHLKEQLETLKADKKVLESYQAVGTPEEVQQVMTLAEKAGDSLKTYEQLGTVSEIKDAFTAIEKHTTHLKENFGSVREIAQVFRFAGKLNERLMKIGTVDEIEKVVENFGSMMTEAEEIKAETEKQIAQKAAEDLSKEVGAPVEDILELLKTKTVPQVKAIYKRAEESFVKKHGINESKKPAAPASRYEKTKVDESVKPKANVEVSESSVLSRRNAGSQESTILGKSRIERINEQLSKVTNK